MSIERFMSGCWVLLYLPLLLLAGTANDVNASDAQTRWIGSWAAAQQLIEPSNALDPADLSDLTLRQVVH